MNVLLPGTWRMNDSTISVFPSASLILHFDSPLLTFYLLFLSCHPPSSFLSVPLSFLHLLSSFICKVISVPCPFSVLLYSLCPVVTISFVPSVTFLFPFVQTNLAISVFLPSQLIPVFIFKHLFSSVGNTDSYQ